MSTVGRLNVVLRLDASQYTQGLRDAGKLAVEFDQSLSDSLMSVKGMNEQFKASVPVTRQLTDGLALATIGTKAVGGATAFTSRSLGVYTGAMETAGAATREINKHWTETTGGALELARAYKQVDKDAQKFAAIQSITNGEVSALRGVMETMGLTLNKTQASTQVLTNESLTLSALFGSGLNIEATTKKAGELGKVLINLPGFISDISNKPGEKLGKLASTMRKKGFTEDDVFLQTVDFSGSRLQKLSDAFKRAFGIPTKTATEGLKDLSKVFVKNEKGLTKTAKASEKVAAKFGKLREKVKLRRIVDAKKMFANLDEIAGRSGKSAGKRFLDFFFKKLDTVPKGRVIKGFRVDSNAKKLGVPLNAIPGGIRKGGQGLNATEFEIQASKAFGRVGEKVAGGIAKIPKALKSSAGAFKQWSVRNSGAIKKVADGIKWFVGGSLKLLVGGTLWLVKRVTQATGVLGVAVRGIGFVNGRINQLASGLLGIIDKSGKLGKVVAGTVKGFLLLKVATVALPAALGATSISMLGLASAIALGPISLLGFTGILPGFLSLIPGATAAVAGLSASFTFVAASIGTVTASLGGLAMSIPGVSAVVGTLSGAFAAATTTIYSYASAIPGVGLLTQAASVIGVKAAGAFTLLGTSLLFAGRSGLKASVGSFALVGKSLSKATRFSFRFIGSLAKMASRFGLITGLAGAAASAVLGFVSIKQFGALQNLGRLADDFDLTTKALQGIQHAARNAGVDSQKLTFAIRQMSRGLDTAKAGDQIANQLEQMGLSLDVVRQMNPDQQLNAIADGMTKLGSDTDRVKASMILFGQENGRMANLLKDGSQGLAEAGIEAASLGKNLSRTDTAKIELANRSVANLRDLFTSVAQRIAVAVAPALDWVVRGLTRWGKSGVNAAAAVSKGFSNVVEWIAQAVDFIGNGGIVFRQFELVVLRGLSNFPETLNAIFEFIFRQFNNLRIVWGEIQQWIAKGLKFLVDNVFGGFADATSKMIDDFVKETDRANSKLRKLDQDQNAFAFDFDAGLKDRIGKVEELINESLTGPKLGDSVRNLAKSFVGAFDEFEKKAEELAKDTIKGASIVGVKKGDPSDTGKSGDNLAAALERGSTQAFSALAAASTKFRDPSLKANQTTAKNTGKIAQTLNTLAGGLQLTPAALGVNPF